jgi:pimeloyl-ACP methyl ester carboxylesterase
LATPSGDSRQRYAFDVRLDVPTLLIHGWQDDVCPLEATFTFRHAPFLAIAGAG